MTKIVTVNDNWQTYQYEIADDTGREFHKDFKPELTPKEMLTLGVFGGTYFNDKPSEFPEDWFLDAKLSGSRTPNSDLNYYGVNASQPLATWEMKGWINEEDPRGWFQWYCRYYIGRRIADEDTRQIKRWKAMTRHIAQVKKYCAPGDSLCRRKQRQALLHWAYDSRKM
jgi:hypothetical protein